MFIVLGSNKPEVFSSIVDSLIVSGYKHRTGRGCYRGEEEQSVIVSIEGEEMTGIIDMVGLGERHSQHSVMMITTKGYCSLLYMKGDKDFTVEDIGILKGVSKAEALKEDAWSNFGSAYFITVPDPAYVEPKINVI